MIEYLLTVHEPQRVRWMMRRVKETMLAGRDSVGNQGRAGGASNYEGGPVRGDRGKRGAGCTG